MTILYDLVFLLFGLVSLPKAIKRRFSNPAYKGMLRRRWTCPAPAPLPAGVPRIWINGVSVGEVASAQPLVRELEARYPGATFTISSTTGTGFQRAQALYGARHQVIGYPLDLGRIVGRFLDRVRPDIVVSMELDLWPNFLVACRRRGVPLVVVGGRISDRSAGRYARARPLLSGPLRAVRLFLAQDAVDAARAVAMGLPEARVRVGGNLKFDLLPGRVEPPPELARLVAGRPVLALASTHHPEEELLLAGLAAPEWRARLRGWLVVVVPRHPERAEAVERTAAGLGFRAVRHSGLDGPAAAGADLLLVDRIGVLNPLYAVARVAFLGGSLVRHGGQNMIEPAALGVATVFGPHVWNFREAVALLLAEGAAVQAPDPAGILAALAVLVDAPERSRALGEAGRAAIAKRRGAASCAASDIVDIIKEKTRGT